MKAAEEIDRLLADKLPSPAADLASDECSYVTGATLIVDGGLTIAV